MTKDDQSKVIDKFKIRRWKKKVMNMLAVRRKQEVGKELSSVYFDSKQCKLLVEKLVNGKKSTANSKEDLYVLVEVGKICLDFGYFHRFRFKHRTETKC